MIRMNENLLKAHNCIFVFKCLNELAPIVHIYQIILLEIAN